MLIHNDVVAMATRRTDVMLVNGDVVAMVTMDTGWLPW